MSDIDDIFAKRLDEEANFPNRGKNWNQMSKRLDAFDAGSVQGNVPRLRGWQIATLIATVAVAGLLWKNHLSERKNRALQWEIIALREEKSNPEAGGLPAAQAGTGVGGTAVYDGQKPAAIENRVSTGVLQYLPHPNGQNTSVHSGASLKAGANKNDEKSSIIADKNPSNQQPDANLAGANAQISGLKPAGLPDSIQENLVLSETQVEEKKDSLQKINTPDSLQNAVAAIKDSIASAPAIAQEIKPLSPAKNRFRVGVQASLGFVQPKQKGISAIKGQGVNLEAKIFRSLWLTASVDWLHHDVSTEAFVPKFHPHHDTLPKPPGSWGGGGPHTSKLILVESAPREQHFGLGIRYTLPIKCWLRPSVRVAHDWVRVSPTLITYKYEDDDPGGPGGPGQHHQDTEYTAEKFDAQWLNNQWRFGLGLEKDMPNWTFGLWADYSKDLSAATPSFDALYLRAGAQYRF